MPHTTGPPASCLDCGARQRCLPRDLGERDCTLFERLVGQRYQLSRGDHLYRTNDPVRDRLYAIRSGQFKTYQLSLDGQQRITGFQYAGDLLGLEAIDLPRHRHSTLALSETVLCEFTHARLCEAAQGDGALAARLREMLSRQLLREQAINVLLARRADQKVAGFLLALPAGRPGGRRNGEVLQLAMNRADIGAYLGLADTTVSRVLTRFQRLGYLTLHRRQLTIVDAAALRAVAG